MTTGFCDVAGIDLDTPSEDSKILAGFGGVWST